MKENKFSALIFFDERYIVIRNLIAKNDCDKIKNARRKSRTGVFRSCIAFYTDINVFGLTHRQNNQRQADNDIQHGSDD